MERFEFFEDYKDEYIWPYTKRYIPAYLGFLILLELSTNYFFDTGVYSLDLVIFLFNIMASTIGAVALLRGFHRKQLRQLLRKENVFLCIPCGYDLEGNESGVCPECGEAVEVMA